MIFRWMLLALSLIFPKLCAMGTDSVVGRAFKVPAPHVFLVVESPKEASEAILPLRLSEEWVDRSLHSVVLVRGASEVTELVPLLSRLERSDLLQQGGFWILTGAVGAPLAAGTGLPAWKMLAPHLESALGPSKIFQLRQFLERNVDHWPARHKLIQRLIGFLPIRIKLLSEWPSTSDLPQEHDLLLWGSLASELDSALSQFDWINKSGGLFLHQRLPRSIPEQHSPLMRELYRKHRPHVLKLLEEYPNNMILSSALIRMNLALGEFKWPIINSTSSIIGNGLQMNFIAGANGKEILQAGIAAGRTREASRVLQNIWTDLVAPTLTSGEFFEMMRGGMRGGSAQIFEAGLGSVWFTLLEPLLESLVLTDAINEAKTLLGTLHGPTAGIVTKERMKALLERLKRRDLEPVLVTQAEPFQPPPARLPWLHRGALVVQSQPPNLRADGLALQLIARGYDIKTLMINLPTEGATALGWEAGKPRWALMGDNQKPLLDGGLLPPAREMVELLDRRGHRPEMEGLLRFLESHPNHLPAWTELMSLSVARVEALGQELGRRKHAAVVTVGDLEVARAQVVRCVRALLTHPMGTMTEVIVKSNLLRVFGSQWDSAEPGFWQATTAPFLARIDADLQRRPNDEWLWRLWIAAHTPLGKSPAERLAKFSPLPGERETLWPSATLLAVIADALETREDWHGVVSLLEARWKGFQAEAHRFKSMKEVLEQGAWDHSLSRKYAVSLIQLKRSLQAERLVDELQAAGLTPSSWGQALDLAIRAKETGLVAKFSSK